MDAGGIQAPAASVTLSVFTILIHHWLVEKEISFTQQAQIKVTMVLIPKYTNVYVHNMQNLIQETSNGKII